MNNNKLSRREAITRTGLLVGAAAVCHQPQSDAAGASSNPPGARPFCFSLNTATLRGHKLGIVKEIEIAAAAGYDGIEPWVEAVQQYEKSGGSLSDLKKRISDSGLKVEGAIGFPEWIVDDDARRAQGLERAKAEMDLMARIGGKRFAAPPAGATKLPKLDLVKAAERYRALLEAGDQIGIVPELELWGFSQNMNRLGECAGVAIETGHPKACVLPDIFHLYKGGSDFHGLALLSSSMVQVLHMNDYPAEPPREKIDDSYRIYPGDGTAPVVEIVRLMSQTGGQKVLSLELFNRKLWTQDPLEVAKTGLAKMKAVAAKAIG
ncbi:MAG TPA: sugar phosphate isomerase/epimerase family protein [Verrucomicrobiae bacterium]